MEKRKVHFLTARFTMPLFMLTRKRLQNDDLKLLRKYLMHKTNFPTQVCKHGNLREENANRTLNHLKHVVGMDERDDKHGPCLLKAKSSRRIHKEILYKRKPQASVHQSHRHKQPKEITPSQLAYKTKRRRPASVNVKGSYFYMPTDASPCKKYKFTIVGNARTRRPCQRMMVADLTSCYKEPHEPTPTTYNPKYFNESFSVEKLYEPIPNPHMFGRQSVVPVKENSVHKKNTSWMPGPGRYDPFYPTSCQYSRKGKLKLGLRLFIDQQKRLKFRGLPYIKIKIKHYRDREWDHVKGHGFQHLFRHDKSAQRLSTKPLEHKSRKRDDLVNINSIDYKYIQTINNPQRKVISFRLQPGPKKEPVIKFTSLEKYVVRKQLTLNKKIAFGTSRDRFPDMTCPVPLTASKLQEIKQEIAPERRFTNKPVMRKSPYNILSKVMTPVAARYPQMNLSLRKKDFRFMPLPEAKLLMTSDELLINTSLKSGFYHKPVAPQKFFTDQFNIEKSYSEISTAPTLNGDYVFLNSQLSTVS